MIATTTVGAEPYAPRQTFEQSRLAGAILANQKRDGTSQRQREITERRDVKRIYAGLDPIWTNRDLSQERAARSERTISGAMRSHERLSGAWAMMIEMLSDPPRSSAS